jgi:hypothetical protein
VFSAKFDEAHRGLDVDSHEQSSISTPILRAGTRGCSLSRISTPSNMTLRYHLIR